MRLRWLNFLKRSLQARFVVATLAVLLLVIWGIYLYVAQVLRQDVLQLQGEQQRSAAGYLATDIAEQLALRTLSLERFASVLQASAAGDLQLQQALQSHSSLMDLFNAGGFLTDLRGNAIASIPVSAGRLGINYQDRDYIRNAIREERPALGQPVIGKALNAPVFGMAVPVRNSRGQVVGALAGVVDLSRPNFLTSNSHGSYAKTGYFLVCDRRSRMIITSSDPKRIMQPLPALHVNPLIDRYMAGYEETGITINPKGVQVLASAKGVPGSDWYIVVAMPTEEAFEPLTQLQQRLLLASLLVTVLGGMLSWWVVRRQLTPIQTAVDLMNASLAGNQPLQPLPIQYKDEVGELIGGFNKLLAEVRNSEQKLATILDSVEAYIYLKDTGGRYLYANRLVRELFGRPMQEIQGQTDACFFDAATVQQISDNDRKVLQEGMLLRTEETNLNLRDGKTAIYLSIKLPLRDGSGEIYALCGISTDITERKQAERQIQQFAFHDSLTGLPNRRLLNDRIEQAIVASRRSGLYCALMFIDLDNFKPLNDEYGHEVGDQLLVEVAERLVGGVREMDTVARLGGDEFVILIAELDCNADVSAHQAGQVADKILAAMAQPYLLTIRSQVGDDRVVHHTCTASIGLVLFVDTHQPASELLKSADMAMYAAKQAGRNTIRFA